MVNINNQIINFKKGLYGFGNFKKFKLCKNEENSFYYLKSLKNEEISFGLINPFSFFEKYNFQLKEKTIKDLNIKNEKNEILILNVLTYNGECKNSTINLKAPIVINTLNNKAKQIILEKNYKIKQPLFEDKQK